MSRIHYIMFEGFTNIVEIILDESGQALMGTSVEQSKTKHPRNKMLIAVELGVFQQAHNQC